MHITFHPPENRAAYEEKVLALLLAAALPVAKERSQRLLEGEAPPPEAQTHSIRAGV